LTDPVENKTEKIIEHTDNAQLQEACQEIDAWSRKGVSADIFALILSQIACLRG
jgi:hypothetical protein